MADERVVMKKWVGWLLVCGAALAQNTQTVVVPREKINLLCVDGYFKTERRNFALLDETYPECQLLLPLALLERWQGRRAFYIIPRVVANLYARNDKGEGKWLPLSPLVNPGLDAFHRTIPSKGYKNIVLVGNFGKLSEKAGKLKPDTIGAGGKLTVCVSPVLRGEQPCVTFDITARFRIYSR
jgi:hypothetical protein